VKRQISPQRAAARKRPPTRVSDQPLQSKTGRPVIAIPVTSRTTSKGDRTGLKVPNPTVEFPRKNGAEHTILPAHERKPETGLIVGARLGPCKACGHTRMSANATRLCGVRSCLEARQVRFNKRRWVREGVGWVKTWDGTVKKAKAS
jgi:hypothetical protein